MSLIKCPECGHEVSSKAETCPQCGVRIAGNVKRCPVCQRTLLMDAIECPHCHTHFEKQPELMLEPGGMSAEEESNTQPMVLPPVMPTEDDAVATSSDAEEIILEGAETPPPPKKNTPWYLLLFVIIILAIGGYLYWDNYQQRRYSEEKAFELLRDCNDPLNFEDFIARYPNSKHLDEVRAQLKELQKEDAAWEVVAKSADVEALQNFIQQHPHSPFIKVALHKIDSLDWRAADKKGTSSAYSDYIALHDAGEYITEAYAARDAAREREERARRDSIAAAQAAIDTVIIDGMTVDPE